MQTTYADNDESIIITHPFHPNVGAKHRVIGIRVSTNRKRLICLDAEGNELLVPIEHTSMGSGDKQGQPPPECRCVFGYNELLELSRIIHDIIC